MHGRGPLRAGRRGAHVVMLSDGSMLNRYWDERDTPRDESYARGHANWRSAAGATPAEVYRDMRAAAESGWDFSSRWFGDGRDARDHRHHRIIPVDLNSLMYGLERASPRGAETQRRPRLRGENSPSGPRSAARGDRPVPVGRAPAPISTTTGRATSASSEFPPRRSTRCSWCRRAGAGRSRGAHTPARLLQGRRPRRPPTSIPASNGTRPTAGRRCSGSPSTACAATAARARADDRLPLDR